MKAAIVILLLGWSCVVTAQDPALRHYTTTGHSADFYISLEDKKIRYIDTLDYYWYKSQKVHVTEGYAGGDLLDGVYTEYYVSGQLSKSGRFELGLRAGEWKSWYESGQLATLHHYSEGVLDGDFYRYNEAGQLIESGHYRNGRYHGKKLDNGEVTRYRNGKEKKKREKKSKPDSGDEDANDEPEELKEHKEKKFWLKFFEEREEPLDEKDKKKEKEKRDKGQNRKQTEP